MRIEVPKSERLFRMAVGATRFVSPDLMPFLICVVMFDNLLDWISDFELIHQ